MADATENPVEHGHGEEIHMPPNSWAPLVTSIGVTATLVGLVFINGDYFFVFFIGLLILIAGVGGWIMAAVKEHGDLH